MRAVLSLVLATLVNLAMLPFTVIALEPVADDAVELMELGDTIDEDAPSSPSLDDDVLHGVPLVHAAYETITWRSEPWHPSPEGRVHPRSRRPPRVG